MTTRVISGPEVWAEHLGAGRRDEVCKWLQENGLDSHAVLSTHPTVIEDTAAGQQIRCHVIEKDAAEPEERVVPLVVPPPPHWPVHETAGTPTAWLINSKDS